MKTILLTLIIAGATAVMAADGADLYKKCASCHGVSGEKAALGKSKIIKDLTKDELVVSLQGYKDGSYGGSMKALMKGQVAALDDKKIDSLASYITSLK